MTATERARALLTVAAAAADSKQGEDLVALDVSGPLPLTDIFLLVTGRNERNVAAIAGEIEDKLLEAGAQARCAARAAPRAAGSCSTSATSSCTSSTRRSACTTALERLWKDCPVDPDRAARRLAPAE